MIRKTRLFTPGPTPLLPAAQFAMAAADIHHRTPEFRALYTRVLAQLKDFVGTKNDVIILSSRRHRSHGGLRLQPHLARRPRPRPHRRQVRRALDLPRQGLRLPRRRRRERPTARPSRSTRSRPPSSSRPAPSSSRPPSPPPASATTSKASPSCSRPKSSEALLIVDAITGLGTTHLDMDGWGIDVLIGGSQKAVMIPPGLSYLAVSPRAWDRMESTYNPRYYFDLRKERKNAAKGESAYTPSRRAHRRAGRIARLHRRTSRRQPRRRPQEASRQRRDLRRHDPRRSHGARLQALRPRRLRSRRRNRHHGSRRHRLRHPRQGPQVAVRRHRHRRPGRDEGLTSSASPTSASSTTWTPSPSSAPSSRSSPKPKPHSPTSSSAKASSPHKRSSPNARSKYSLHKSASEAPPHGASIFSNTLYRDRSAQ